MGNDCCLGILKSSSGNKESSERRSHGFISFNALKLRTSSGTVSVSHSPKTHSFIQCALCSRWFVQRNAPSKGNTLWLLTRGSCICSQFVTVVSLDSWWSQWIAKVTQFDSRNKKIFICQCSDYFCSSTTWLSIMFGMFWILWLMVLQCIVKHFFPFSLH